MKNDDAVAQQLPCNQNDHSKSPLEAVLTRLEAETPGSFGAVEPLYETLDPDALDALCTHAQEQHTPLELTFSHAGYDVRVTVDQVGEIGVDLTPV